MTPSRIVLRDPDFLVVEKPAGIATQPLPHPIGQTLGSAPPLASLLAENYPELKSVGGSDWGAVHRLDRETSGLVVFARNQETYESLRQSFSQNRVEREYVAVVEGEVTKGGKINWPIGPDPKSSRKVRVYKNLKEARRNKAQEAVTIYEPLTPSLLRISIKTGRRHQIRAHLKAIGHPVLKLHASRLKFIHPKTDRPVEVVSRRGLTFGEVHESKDAGAPQKVPRSSPVRRFSRCASPPPHRPSRR